MVASLLILTIVASGISLATAAPANAASTVTVPSTIDASGATDVTAALNAFFASVPDGSTITFPRAAFYRIESTLYFADRHNLTIDGNGGAVAALTSGAGTKPPDKSLAPKWPRQRAQLVFHGGSNITIRNLSIHGANPHGGATSNAFVPTLEEQDGIWLQGVQGALIDSVHVNATYGDTISIAGNVGNGNPAPSDHVTIRSSDLERSGRQGISITDATNVVIQNNVIAGAGRSLLDVEPASAKWVAQHIVFSDNTVGAFNNVFLADRGAGGGVGDITVQANVLKGPMAALTVDAEAGAGYRQSSIRIVNNTSEAPGTANCKQCPMMRFVRIDGIQVQGNTEPIATGPQASGIPVRAIQSCNITIKGNTFAGMAVLWQTDGYSTCGPLPAVAVGTPTGAAIPAGGVAVGPAGTEPPTTGAVPSSTPSRHHATSTLLYVLIGAGVALLVALAAFITVGRRRRGGSRHRRAGRHKGPDDDEPPLASYMTDEHRR